MMVRRWTAVLHELDLEGGGGTPEASDTDDEWQQLSAGVLLDAQGAESQLAAAGSLVFEDENDPEGPRMSFRRVSCTRLRSPEYGSALCY